MVQDFAKTPKSSPEVGNALAAPTQPSALSLLSTGLITGLALGLFISFLVYISGALPTPPGLQESAMASARDSVAQENEDTVLTEELERAATRLQLEFYRELPNYEIVVDATPLDLPPAQRRQPAPETGSTTSATTETTGSTTAIAITAPTPAITGAAYMIQAGAFQQQTSAELQGERLQALGLDAQVKQEALLGRTLYLVQSGPYSRDQISQVERILRSNNIDSMRITLGSR